MKLWSCMVHLICYPWINLVTSNIPIKGKICGFQIFSQRKKSVINILSNTTSYNIVWQILLYISIFGCLMMSSTTREERCKHSIFLLYWKAINNNNNNFFGIFMVYTRWWWISNQDSYLLNYCRMLYSYSIERIALFQVGTSPTIWEHQSIINIAT